MSTLAVPVPTPKRWHSVPLRQSRADPAGGRRVVGTEVARADRDRQQGPPQVGLEFKDRGDRAFEFATRVSNRISRLNRERIGSVFTKKPMGPVNRINPA